jgi:hypothetical protein
MSSEYGFVSTHSRRMRRVVRILLSGSAVLAGGVAMALIVALPLQPRSDAKPMIGHAETSTPAATPSQKGGQQVTGTLRRTVGTAQTQNSVYPAAALRTAATKVPSAAAPASSESSRQPSLDRATDHAPPTRSQEPNDSQNIELKNNGDTTAQAPLARLQQTQKNHVGKRSKPRQLVRPSRNERFQRELVEQNRPRQETYSRGLREPREHRFTMWPFFFNQ